MSALDFRKMLREERRLAALKLNPGQETKEADKPSTSSTQGQDTRSASVNKQQIDGCHHNIVHTFSSDRVLALSAQWDVNSFALPGYAGMYYAPNTVSEGTERDLLRAIKTADCQWEVLRGRQLQQWGVLPSGGQGQGQAPAFTSWLNTLADELVAANVFPPEHRPNNTLINRYESGEGILHHTDGPRYHDCVAVLSLGSDCIMTFRPNLSSSEIGVKSAADAVSVVLQARSLFVFSGPWYREHLHGIHCEDPQIVGQHAPVINGHIVGLADGEEVERSRRISITMRAVVP